MTATWQALLKVQPEDEELYEDVGHGAWIEREILAQIGQLFRRNVDLRKRINSI